MSWKKVSGVLFDKKISARIKRKMHKSVVRPVMLHVMETAVVTDRQVKKMKVAEFKMVVWSLGVARMDKVRDRYQKRAGPSGHRDISRCALSINFFRNLY